MRKIDYIEERYQQQLHQFLANLVRELPDNKNAEQLFCSYAEQLETFTNLTFSANVLYRGVVYANQLYSHIVKIEYKRLKNYIINKQLDKEATEIILKQLNKTRNRLLKESPLVKKTNGTEILYAVIGGYRQKYAANRRAVCRMHQSIEQQMKHSHYRYYKKCLFNWVIKKKKAVIWQLKSFTWR